MIKPVVVYDVPSSSQLGGGGGKKVVEQKRVCCPIGPPSTQPPLAQNPNLTQYPTLSMAAGQRTSETHFIVPNPIHKYAPPVCTVPDTQRHELGSFVASLKSVPNSGMHNPMKNVERYLKFGEIPRKVSIIRVQYQSSYDHDVI